jgi:hypothetical protein
MSDEAKQNLDRDIYRAGDGDYYADRIFISPGGGIGFSVGGNVIVKPLRDWWALGIATTWEGPRIKEPDHGIGQGKPNDG